MIRKETHPKSAASIKPWFADLWEQVKDYDYKLIGKPYGALPMLEAFGIEEYQRPGIEHDSPVLKNIIDYADFTLGNSVGIAIGIKIANPDSSIFTLISDAQLYMGVVQEALILVKEYQFKNFNIVIDYNHKGSKEECDFNLSSLNSYNCFLKSKEFNLNFPIILVDGSFKYHYM